MSAEVTEANTLTRQLWHIAGTGDLEQLDELLNQGADVNAGDRTGVTALMRAAYHGQLAMVRALIFYGADPTKKDRSGLTALMMAEYGGHDEIVEALESFSAEGKTAFTKKRRVTASVTEENVDLAPDYEDSTSDETPETSRKLHEPLEIWEMVRTTQTESHSPPGRSRRVFSPRILALAVGALIICFGAVFGFLALRGAMSAADDTSEQKSEATKVNETSSSDERLSTSKSLAKTSGKNARASNELTKLKPVENAEEFVDRPAVASSAPSAKKSSGSQRPKATKVSATIPKQKNVKRPTKLEEEVSGKSAKKEPAAASDPVKPSPRPKPKVIEWP